MLIKQISVFLENKTGSLAEITEILYEAGLNIRTLVIVDTGAFGVLRLIVDDWEYAGNILKTHGFAVKTHDVVAVKVHDAPGGVHSVLKFLNSRNINVEFIYAFTRFSGKGGLVIFRSENLPETAALLKKSRMEIVDGGKIYKIK